MKRLVGGLVAVAVILVGAQPAFAARTRVHELAESPVYKEKAGGMIGRGLLNGVTCFVDPVVHVVNETKAGPPLIGTLTGVASGVGCGVLRLGSGALDIVTFWVPGFNGFPVSDSYENCLAQPAAQAWTAPARSTAPPASSWDMPVAEPSMPQAPEADQAAPAPAKQQWSK